MIKNFDRHRITAWIICVAAALNLFMSLGEKAYAEEVKIDAIAYYAENSQVAVRVQMNTNVEGTVVALLLESGITVAIVDAAAEEEVLMKFPQGFTGNEVKVFLWDSISGMEPLCGAVAVKVDEVPQNAFLGKTLYVDGDSICYGNGYKGGFGKIIADKYGMELINNGVGGATICQNTCDDVPYGSLDWENNTYYLGLTYTIPSTKSNYQDGFRFLLDENTYNNGFGVYPTYYKFVNGEIVEQPYTETMPTNCKWYIKFDIPTYGGNTVEKYVAMWAYPNSDGTYSTPESNGNRWLWEAYKSGFKGAHQSGYAKIGVPRHWLSKSVEDIPADADYIILESGINDYLLNRRLGEITEDYTSAVDTTTVIGGMEYICRQMLEKGAGKKLLFVLTPKAKNFTDTKNVLGGVAEYKTLTEYHDAIISVLKKYDIDYVDLFETEFDTAKEEFLKYTHNNDGVHPTKEGYELYFVPYIEKAMAE